MWYQLKNSLAVKKGAALFKTASVKSCEIKGGGQEMTVINIKNSVLLPSEAGRNQHKLTRIVVIKLLPSTYTITDISWPPPLISQLVSYWPFQTGPHLFLRPGCFWVDWFMTSFDIVKQYNSFMVVFALHAICWMQLVYVYIVGR